MALVDIAALAGVPAAILGLVSIEGVTAHSRARRRARAAADVASLLPEGSAAREVALEIAGREVEFWRRHAAPTPDEAYLRWIKASIVLLVVTVGGSAVLLYSGFVRSLLGAGMVLALYLCWSVASLGAFTYLRMKRDAVRP
ncbi:hypothetical protein [Janibacter melonis]|uniref:hypothetical protein n=1 Tax=Janibacter melonis TaxID=262209 RepID=UPI001E56008E|nr:hypothetical protein [Janibacter melonis]MCB5993209.1 hypothetical protein [Janibacter melonis]